MDYKLEVIGFSTEGCIAAQHAGAGRIELCDNPAAGGTTPSYGFIKIARQILNLELFVMIRPRGGDFIYSSHEFNIMADDIKVCKELGCDGVVLGMLNKHGDIDKDRAARLVSLAYPMEVTFHRAFDRAREPLKALQDIIDIGCDRLLTSGQRPTANEGIDLLKQLIQHSGNLIIMPGAGIRSENLQILAENLNTYEFHTSARSYRPSLQPRAEFLNDNADPITTDVSEIKKMVSVLQNCSKIPVQEK